MAYKEAIIEVLPGSRPPPPTHSEDFYCHQELIKVKGRRKKSDPIEYRRTFVPWGEINDTELMALVMYGQKFASKEEMARYRVVSRGLRRVDMIGVVNGSIDARTLPENRVHDVRSNLQTVILSNWKFIHTQIRCNTLCWECTDAKALECGLDNRELIRMEEGP